jgi:hypothetical protein
VVLESYLELLVSALLNLKYLNMETSGEIASRVLSIINAVVFGGLPIYSFIYIWAKKNRF